MRIRKNAKLSPLLFSSSSSSQQGGSVPVETFQTHVCHLNQSPWDVIPFDSDSIQFEGEDSFTAGNNGSAGDSIGAVESVASMMEAEDKHKIEDMVLDDNHDNGGNKCKSLDEKGSPCKNEVKQGQSFCYHHLSLLRSYNNSGGGNGGCYNKKPAASTAGARRGARGRATAKKAPSSSNPYEFYYYSGFGPLWGKRRGDRNGGEGSKNSVIVENSCSTMVESENVIASSPNADVVVNNTNNNSMNNNNNSNIQSSGGGVVVTYSSTQVVVNEEFDYVDDDEEEDANEDESGKKRMRKPVKARSLKSLM